MAQDLEEPTLTRKDMQDIIEWGIPNKMTFISLSFTKDGECVNRLKSVLAENKSEAQVIAKVRPRCDMRSAILTHARVAILTLNPKP